ncbi:stalk domain-containing protein [Paenibacillus sp. Soil787]|uniref:stalk domain-containing protein n=1 Tax=Paenibacillus sp. Soil787 TaxID=1736411 RepID=UPI000703A3B1|nr:stalk domain-containing protein [Paenibacillus sp. Soil787]KRF27635.1 hypothetical protein ASG93_29260 [Paenibacillus sp. Soil787]
MRKAFLSKKRWITILVLILVVSNIQITTFAEESIPTSNFVVEDELKVNESGAVWTAFDNQEHRQVYYSPKMDGKAQAISQSFGIRERPVVGGNLVVWLENRHEARGLGIYDLYAYDLETKEERKITVNNEWNGSVTTDGRYIAWIEEETRIVNLYDWQTKLTTQIGKGNNPVVAKGKLAYENNGRNQILLFQPMDHSTKTLLTVPTGRYLSGFQFNGDWLLYLSNKQAFDYKLSLQKADGTSGPLFESGTEFVSVLGSMVYSSLNKEYAVFQVFSSEKKHTIVIDLDTGQAKPLNIPGDRETILGIQGDSLYYSQEKQGVQTLSISKTLESLTGEDPLLPKVSTNSNLNPTPAPSRTNHDADQLIVALDGKNISFQVNPVVEDGSSMVQFRPLFEAMGMSIEWQEENQTIIGAKGKFRIELKLGDKTALVNGKTMDLPVAPHTINGSTMVPLRFVAESTGRSVYWVASYTEKEVHISRTIASDLFDDLYSDNLVYLGETLNGVPNGQGTYTKNGRLRYEGQFVNGAMEGSGSVYQNGKIFYKGELKDNLPNGQGKLYELGLYVGQFVNGLRHGIGKYYENNGALIYSGQFTEDTETGKGTLYESNGTRYVGDVIMGIREGLAEVYDQDGDLQYKGRYAGNHPVLKGTQLTYMAMLLYAQAGKDTKANAMFEEAKKSANQGMVPYYMIAETYISLNNADKSNEYIQVGLSKDANDPILNAYLALTYALQNKPDQAKVQMDKAKTLGLKKAEVWDERLKAMIE